jgi:hypothetical protein
MVVLAPLRAVIFATTGLTMTASASQLLQNLPHITFVQLDATMQPGPQDNQLMSKHRVLSLKP